MYLDEPGRAPDGSPFVNGSPQNLVIHDIGSNPPVVNSTLHANILTGGVSSAEGIVTDGVFHRVVAKLEFDAGSVAGAEKLSVWLDHERTVHLTGQVGQSLGVGQGHGHRDFQQDVLARV